MLHSFRQTPALTLRSIVSSGYADRRIWLCLLAVLIALYAPLQSVGTANAATLQMSAATEAAANSMMAQAASQPGVCAVGSLCPTYAPLPLLNLDGLGVTDAQKTSLQNLSEDAVEMVIQGHGLSDGDKNAVLTWGRNDAQAALYWKLLEAIDAPSPTADQKNAAAWLQSMLGPDISVVSAQDAAREYAKWAGLDQSGFETLLKTNPSQAQLKAFLGGDNPEPLNYNNTNISAATGGYCAYRSPSPYQTEYQGYLSQLCSTPCITCLPPAPSYDQFVKWGDADANATWSSKPDSEQQARNIAAGLGIFPALAVAGSATAVQFAIQYTRIAALEVVDAAEPVAAASEISTEAVSEVLSTFFVGSAVTLLATILAAIVTAVLVGIDVSNQAQLPGKLATLITTAESTQPDLVSLKKTTAGQQTIFGIFVAATLPMPVYGTCDNSDKTRGLTNVQGFYVINTGLSPCLNPTPITGATATDPQFVVQQNGASTQSVLPSISWKDSVSGATTQARLSKTWFVTTDASSQIAQSLSIVYTDWKGKEQRSWIVGNDTDGYGFLNYPQGVDATKGVDLSSCASSGYCSKTMNYVGADGKQYSASIRGYAPPTGTPIVTTSNPLEGTPVKFDANNFAPAGATGAISYQWRFQAAGCGGIACQSIGGGPAYEDPVAGARVAHTWGTWGTYSVQLTATDAIGATGSMVFNLPVGDLPPALTLGSDPRTGVTATGMLVEGTLTDPGSLSTQTVSIDWGDGQHDSACAATRPLCLNISTNPLQMSGTTTATGALFTFNGTHAYTNPGTYYGMVSDTDGVQSSGATFVMTIAANTAVKFAPIADHTYGDAPVQISATGGGSGQPIAFAVAGDQSVCSVSGSGSATLTLLKAGTCAVTAADPGASQQLPIAPVTQTFAVKPAVLTVTASSPTIVYPAAVPAITPSYSGFVKGETATILTTPPTCIASVPATVSAGTYATKCTGAAAPNYTVSQVPGTLTIKKATPTIALVTDKASIIQGDAISLKATVAAQSPGGANPTGVVMFFDMPPGLSTNAITGCDSVNLDPTTGTASCKVPSLQWVGNHTLTARYLGDTNDTSVIASNLTLAVNPGGSTTTTITNVSATPAFNAKPVTFTASVAVVAPASGFPVGTVTFLDGTTSLGSAPVQQVTGGKAQATFTTWSLSMGSHQITARYDGLAGFTQSTSAAVQEWVSLDPGTLPRNPSGAYMLSDRPGAILAGLFLGAAQIWGNMSNAVFVGSDLTGARLAGDFDGADFSHAILANANLSSGGNSFQNANFTGANLIGADLRSANFSGATGLVAGAVSNVKWFQATCPDGTFVATINGTCVGHL
jgi:hypothetical protein